MLISIILLLAGCFEQGDWSPNSRYAVEATGKSIFIYDVKTKTSEPLFFEPRKDYKLGHARFLDNDTILALRYQEPQVEVRSEGKVISEKKPLKPMNLTMIDRQTGKHRDLATIKAMTEMPPIWASFDIAPDKKTVIFVESPQENTKQLKRIDIATGKITDTGISAIHPSFSPDGKLLVAIDPEGKKKLTLYLMKSDGTLVTKREIKQPSFMCEPEWDPSSKHFYLCTAERTVSRISITDLSLKTIYQTKTDNDIVVSLHHSKNKPELYISLYMKPESSKLLRLNTKSGVILEMPGFENEKKSSSLISESPDGKWLYLSHTGIIELPDLKLIDTVRTGPFTPPVIPDTPISGKAEGHAFRADKAVYKEGTLTITTQKPDSYVYDAILSFFIRGTEMGSIPESKTYLVSTNKDLNTILISPSLNWQIENGNTSKWIEDFDLSIIFGKESEPGKLPVKLYISSKDPDVEISGSFIADVEGFRIINGIPDLTVDSTHTLRYITGTYLKNTYKGKKVNLTWTLWASTYAGEVVQEFTVDGNKKQFIKILFKKYDKGWKVERTLKPYELFKAHPITLPANNGDSTKTEQAELIVAQTIEAELLKGDKNVVIYDEYFNYEEQDNEHASVEVKYKLMKNRKAVNLKREFLLEWVDNAWLIKREVASK